MRDLGFAVATKLVAALFLLTLIPTVSAHHVVQSCGTDPQDQGVVLELVKDTFENGCFAADNHYHGTLKPTCDFLLGVLCPLP